MSRVLELTDQLFFSQGKNRQCYIYPDDDRLCVKVLHEHSPVKTQQRETRYFNYLNKRGTDWDMVVPLKEMVPTNRGLGAVFELLRDYDHQVSRSLEYYMLQKNSELDALIVSELKRLKKYLLEEIIIFRDLNPLNLLLQQVKPGEYRLMVVDGIGHNDFLPICQMSQHFGREKIKRTWNRKLDYWFSRYDNIFGLVTPY